MGESTDRFVRRQNVERFTRLLISTTVADRRQHLAILLVKKSKNNKNSGDPEYPYKTEAALFGGLIR